MGQEPGRDRPRERRGEPIIAARAANRAPPRPHAPRSGPHQVPTKAPRTHLRAARADGHASLEARRPPPRRVGPCFPPFRLSLSLSLASLVCQEHSFLPPRLASAAEQRNSPSAAAAAVAACYGGRDPTRRLSPAVRYGTIASPLRACPALILRACCLPIGMAVRVLLELGPVVSGSPLAGDGFLGSG